MQQDNPKKVTYLMRKALPLMQKLGIPPTPFNYGIWYEYVSNRNEKLNNIVDETLRKLGNLPSFLSRELFHEHLLGDEFHQGKNQCSRLEKSIRKIERSTHHMSDSLVDLNSTLNKSRKALKHANKYDHLEKVIRYLEHGTQKATENAQLFNQTLTQVQQDIAQIKNELSELQHHSEWDTLTQLVNQRGLERQFYQWLSYAEDDLVLILITIDNLSLINKQYGEQAEISLIRYISNILKERQPGNSSLARINGGEFAILLKDSTLDVAHQYAKTLKEHIARYKVRHKPTKMTLSKISVSIGIAALLGKELPEELFSRAKNNLNSARQSGGNAIYTH